MSFLKYRAPGDLLSYDETKGFLSNSGGVTALPRVVHLLMLLFPYIFHRHWMHDNWNYRACRPAPSKGKCHPDWIHGADSRKSQLLLTAALILTASTTHVQSPIEHLAAYPICGLCYFDSHLRFDDAPRRFVWDQQVAGKMVGFVFQVWVKISAANHA